MLHWDLELLEVDINIEKFQSSVPWKMEYFHAAETVVERGYPPENSLEEGGLDLLEMAGKDWV